MHQEKSGLFSGCGHARQELRALRPRVQVLTSFKDLGVEQLAGASGQAALQKRIRATADRFVRLGGLPLPYAVRVRAAAASGVQAAVSGLLRDDLRLRSVAHSGWQSRLERWGLWRG